MKEDNIQQELRELKILNKIAFQLNGASELEEALQTTLKHMVELMQMQTAWIWLLHPDSNSVFLSASHNLPPALTQHPERLSGWCYCIDKYLANNLESAANISEITCTRLKDLAEGTNELRYHASVPLYASDKKIGLLNMLSKTSGQLTKRQLDLLHTIGDLLSVAIDRARLFEKSKTAGVMEERQRLARQIEQNLTNTIDQLLLKITRFQSGENPDKSNQQLTELKQMVINLQNSIGQSLNDLSASSTTAIPDNPIQYPSSPLTRREFEVLELLKKGKTNKTIAAQLFISERTVKFHVSTILGKLNARNRTNAVQIAVTKGIISF